MNCIKCGGDMVGDGYTSVFHCEYANEADYEFHEADADPVYCNYKDFNDYKFKECDYSEQDLRDLIDSDFARWVTNFCPYQKEIFDDNKEITIHKTSAIGMTTALINVGTIGHINHNSEVLKLLIGDRIRDIPDKIIFCSNPENMANIQEYLEHFSHDVIDEAFVIKAHDRRYMILEPEIEPIRQDPFWTQQGKRTKGKRGRY